MDELRRIRLDYASDDETDRDTQHSKDKVQVNADDHNFFNPAVAQNKTASGEAGTAIEHESGCNSAGDEAVKNKYFKAPVDLSSPKAKRVKVTSQSYSSVATKEEQKVGDQQAPKQDASYKPSGYCSMPTIKEREPVTRTNTPVSGKPDVEVIDVKLKDVKRSFYNFIKSRYKYLWSSVEKPHPTKVPEHVDYLEKLKRSGNQTPYFSTAVVDAAPNFNYKFNDDSIAYRGGMILVEHEDIKTVQEISYSRDLDAKMLRTLRGKRAKLVLRNEIEEIRDMDIYLVPATDERRNAWLDTGIYCVACDDDVSLYVRGAGEEWKGIDDVTDR